VGATSSPSGPINADRLSENHGRALGSVVLSLSEHVREGQFARHLPSNYHCRPALRRSPMNATREGSQQQPHTQTAKSGLQVTQERAKEVIPSPTQRITTQEPVKRPIRPERMFAYVAAFGLLAMAVLAPIRAFRNPCQRLIGRPDATATATPASRVPSASLRSRPSPSSSRVRHPRTSSSRIALITFSCAP
jgi:hypothetical protein